MGEHFKTLLTLQLYSFSTKYFRSLRQSMKFNIVVSQKVTIYKYSGNIAHRKAKRGEIWDSRVLEEYLWGTFFLV